MADSCTVKIRRNKMSTIPIIIDDIKRYETFRMSRCTFFSIAYDLSSPDWVLELEDSSIPFFLLGLSGIIWKPMGKKNRFDSCDSISQLFDKIEELPELYVDTNDIWLPNRLFKDLPHKRGFVYRVRVKLFTEALRYREDQTSQKQFLASCSGLKDSVSFSKKETDSFRKWTTEQVEEARALYPKSEGLALKWSTVP